MQATEKKRYEIRFSGSGGQGLITAAVILAEAVGVFDGKYVCQTQSYGPEARGGKSKAEVVISESPIDYPKARHLDLLLAMNQAACDAYYRDLPAGGLLVVDSYLVEQWPTSRIVAIPFTQIAKETFGSPLVANMIALGVVGRLSRQVKPESLEKALLARMPAGACAVNQEALQRGMEEAAKINLDALPRSLQHDDEV
jgi:2-oxoglutarate ferredoxin oxidoreductase subunit gamma